MASQIYKTSSHEEYIIIGNDALMKCVIPSFVADFVSVIQWEDSEGNTYIKDSTIMGNEQWTSVSVVVVYNQRKYNQSLAIGFIFLIEI